MDLFGDNSDSEVEPFGMGLIAPAPIRGARVTTTTFGGLLSTPLKLHEDLSKGCGGQRWPAGETLTKYLLRRYAGFSGLRGKRIVELGAGGGLTGLVEVKPRQFSTDAEGNDRLALAAGCDLQGSELFITDMDAMLDLIRRNAELNGLQERVRVELLDW